MGELTKPVLVKFSVEEKAALVDLAGALGLPMNVVLRLALREFASRQSTRKSVVAPGRKPSAKKR